MLKRNPLIFFILFSFIFCIAGFSQTVYQFEITKTPVVCGKGSASLTITGAEEDTVNIAWSNGQTHVNLLRDLEEGNYSVNVTIKNKLDTSLSFTIDKEECPVSITRQFTPNGDGYNDLFFIGNVANYPNFEIDVYNKWGQRVHHQKGDFTPWDGKWAGVNVPDGTYYYIFLYDSGNKSKFLKGDINIMR